jgi:hypothetical protein
MIDSSDDADLTVDQALAMMRRVEQEPLAAGATEIRRKAFEWVARSKQVGTIEVDTDYLHDLEEWYPFKGEMLMQYVFGMVTWKLAGDSLREDRKTQIEAGLRSVLAAYKNILAADPKLHESFLDRLDGIRKLGKLREYIDRVDHGGGER